MGGIGSGRRPSCSGKTATNDAMPLDIRKLSRKGLLTPGNCFSWQWLINDQPVSGLSIRVGYNELTLSYRKRSTGEIVEQRVLVETTPCRFGGTRPWFTCPQCRRRVAVVYARGRYFACRKCCDLAYPTQNEGVGSRASTKADKIRKRLGWPVGVLNPAGGKPKGMHWKTFDRLRLQHDVLSQVSFHDIGRKLGFLHRLLER
jgi:hypothetical protein